MLVDILGSADNKFAGHEFLVMQFLYGAFGFVDGLHLDKRKAFGSLRLAMADYLNRHDLAHAVEKFGEIAFGGIEGQVADVQAGGGHLDGLWLAADPRGF